MRLGEEVLHKIQELLIEVDKPKSPRKKVNKSNQYVRRQNVNNQNENRLYNYYKEKRNRENEREKQKMYDELQSMQPFRVQNKKSIYLNSQKQHKPIHERTPQILRKKEMSIEMKRIQIEKEKERRKLLMEQNEEDEEEIIRQRLQKKISKKKLNEILQRLTQRQNERLNRQNAEKLNNLKNRLKENKMKPTINETSGKIWQKRQMERSLSANVFERFQKYGWDQKKKKEDLLRKEKEQVTPFHPKISKNSRIIMQKSASRVSLINFDRSPSCKCLKKNTTSTYLHTSRNTNVTPRRKKNKEF